MTNSETKAAINSATWVATWDITYNAIWIAILRKTYNATERTIEQVLKTMMDIGTRQ